MSSYLEAFERQAGAGFFGGPIEPFFEGSPPEWLKRCLPQIAVAYAAKDLDGHPLVVSKEHMPNGANFAVRRKDQLLYPYNPCLGRQPGSSMGGEEVAVLTAMLDAGIEGWWVPKARVRHYTPKNRQTTRYLRSYYYGEGQRHTLYTSQDGIPLLFRAPRFLWRQVIASELKYRFRRYLFDSTVWVEDLKSSAWASGGLRAWRSRRP
jgi:hypothetical protein